MCTVRTYVRRWNGTAPGCLGPVLEAMEHSGEVRKMSEWSLEGGGGGWVSWGIGMLGQPLSWAWNNYVSPKKEVTKSYTGEYILLAPVKVSMDIVCTRRDNYNSLASDICQANVKFLIILYCVRPCKFEISFLTCLMSVQQQIHIHVDLYEVIIGCAI